MKRTRFTEEQIIGMLKEAEAGAKTADLARRYGVTEAVEIVETAVEVNTEIAAEQAVPHVTTEKSLAMLVAISASLENDLPETGLS